MVAKRETIETALLRSFAEVARRRSVTAAGEALGLPKSAVSKHVSALERRVGARLLERSTRRVAPTQTGLVLLARAESILAELDQLKEDVREQSELLRGVVHVTAPWELGTLLAERFFPALLDKHPALEVTLDLGYAFDDLLDPRYDLAFRVGDVHDDRLVARRVGGLRRILVASRGYLAAHRVRALPDLTRCNCLAFSPAEREARWTLEKDGRSEEVPVRGNFAARGFTALVHAAKAGLGVARVPSFSAHDAIAAGSLVRVLPGWAAPASEVLVVHRFGHERVRRVKAVLDAAQEALPKLLAR